MWARMWEQPPSQAAPRTCSVEEGNDEDRENVTHGMMNFLIHLAEFAQNRFHGASAVIDDTVETEAAASTQDAESQMSDPSSSSRASPFQEDISARRARDNLRQRFRTRGGLMVPEGADRETPSSPTTVASQQLAPVVEEGSTSPGVPPRETVLEAESPDKQVAREMRRDLSKLPSLSRLPPRQNALDPYEPVKPSKLESIPLCNSVTGTWPPCKKARSRRKLEHITAFRKELVETLADNAATQNNRDLWMQCDRVGAALSAKAATKHQLEPSESELQAKLFQLASSPQADLDEVRRLRRLLSKCGAASQV